MKPNLLNITASIIITLILSSIAMNAFFKRTNPQKKDPDGHILTELWADYKTAVNQDRPAKQIEILKKIREQSMSHRLPWDFYDASTRYISASASRDWKLRDSLRNELSELIRKFDEPIVTFFWMLNNDDPASEIFYYVQEHADNLKATHNNAFYGRGYHRYGGLPQIFESFQQKFYANDYEFALWRLLPFTGPRKVATGPIYDALKSYEGASYPLGTYLEYLAVKVNDDVTAEDKLPDLQKFADKYNDKAISLLAKADILSFRLEQMIKNHASSQEFEKFYNECQDFETLRKSFRGTEAQIAAEVSDVRNIINRLTDKNIRLDVEDGKIIVCLRNIDELRLKMFPSEETKRLILDKTLKNDKNSFFVEDTLKLDLPAVADGDYKILADAGKSTSRHIVYSSHKISLAYRQDSRGRCIYAADYKTGKPVDKADVTLLKNGKAVLTHKDFSFDGFTPLPADIASKLEDKSYFELMCSFTDDTGLDRKSHKLSIYGTEQVTETEEATVEDNRHRACNIFTDRGAYNPGDTVDFKAVIYYTDYVNSAEVSPAAAKYKVLLVNAEDKEVSSLSLQTNDFGSIAGQFVIPKDGKNGYYKLKVVSDPEDSAGSFTKSIRVDDFILPTFDVSFDKVDKLYLPGDEIIVTGNIISYSGHAIASDKAVYEVESYGEIIASGQVKMEDGKFTVKFSSKNERYGYRITIKITDDTGETHEYGKSVYVANAINLQASLVNAADARGESLRPYFKPEEWDRSDLQVLMSDMASVVFSVDSDDGLPVPASISYSLENESGKVLFKSTAKSGVTQSIDLKELASGLYVLRASLALRSQAGKEYADSTELEILLMRETDSILDAPVENVVVPLGTEVRNGKAEMLFGTADGEPIWAWAEVFGQDAELLETRLIRLEGKRGSEGSLKKISFDYKDEYPDAVRVQLFFFKDSEEYSYSYEYHRLRTQFELPLSFSTFVDETLPSKRYTFSINTLPDVECLAAIFDKSTETIKPNYWNMLRMRDFHVKDVYVNAVPGGVADDVILDFGSSPVRYSRSMKFNQMDMVGAPMAEAVLCENSITDAGAASYEEQIPVRERFANALTFQPFLRSDSKGNISFNFETSDKLSTYIVSLYAHDRKMHNATLRRDMLVTIPVKVGLVEPKYLYSTDNYKLAASVSSMTDHDVTGTLILTIYRGGDLKALAGAKPLSVQSRKISVPAGSSIRSMFEVNAASYLADTLGLKLVFTADGEQSFSDGMFVSVPVRPAQQALTESHSAVLLSGMDKDSLVERLRKEFTNVDGADADVQVISILDMIRDAIPSKVEPAGKDVLSLSEAMYVRELSYSLRTLSRMPVGEPEGMSDKELFAKVFACHNADGGFGWFEGMKSSPVITAVLLERFAKMKAAGFLDGSAVVENDAASSKDIDAILCSAVRYLDKILFSGNGICPLWCGGISYAQYMFVRSMYASVPFEIKRSADKIIDKKLKDFRKDAKDFLVPKEVRGLNGQIMAKVRRLSILRNLAASKDGAALAKAWGLGINLDSRLKKSIEADVVSLLEYAVNHKDGGVYYPNLAMPFRGLLESEAYAHAMLCDLLRAYVFDAGATPTGSVSVNAAEASRVSDGIRIWLMLQKETQHWDSEPAFVDALNSVINGSSEVKATSVVSLTKTYSKAFAEIKAAGNGFKLERRFFREEAESGGKLTRKEIQPGDVLHVGDKIIVEYRIHNDENRSFVRLTAPREAAFRPVDQLSGYYGWWMSPLRVDGWYSFTPQGYRDVKTDRTEYMFDSYPEENTVITEEFFVTQSGTFTAPVPVIESLYAPHYRANSAYPGDVAVR